MGRGKIFFSYLFVFLNFLLITFCFADPQHGIEMYRGSLKYGADFKHFDYVNPQALKGGSLVLKGSRASYDSFNPFVIKGVPVDGLTPLHPSLLHVTLMMRAADTANEYYCYAAESVDLATDNLSVIFRLREGIDFHDKTPITADDVIYSFRMLMEKGNPFYRSYFASVKDVEKIDQRTVKFVFKNGESLEQGLIVGEMPILSKSYFSKVGFEKANLVPPVGNGPYKISKFEPGRYVAYERVRDWWGDKLPINVGRYNFDQIRYEYYRDETVAFEAFKAGEYDFRVETSIKNWVNEYNFSAVKEGNIIKAELTDKNPEPAQVLMFNLRKPMFQDVRVRQALNYLFDFEFLNRAMFYGLYRRLTSYFQGSDLQAQQGPGEEEKKILQSLRITGFPKNLFEEEFALPKMENRHAIRDYEIKAKDLFQQAGWVVEGNRWVHRKTGEPFVFEIITQTAAFEKSIMHYIKRLKRFGVEVSLRVVDSSQYMQRLQNFDFDMTPTVIAQSNSPGNEQREFWHSSRAEMIGSRNYIGIKNPVVDEVVDQIIAATTRQDLIIRTRVLDRILAWSYYAIPLWYSPSTRVAYKKTIQFPEKVPDYGFDFYAGWINAPAKQ